MKLSQARLCLDCADIGEMQVCFACGSRQTWPIARWLDRRDGSPCHATISAEAVRVLKTLADALAEMKEDGETFPLISAMVKSGSEVFPLLHSLAQEALLGIVAHQRRRILEVDNGRGGTAPCMVTTDMPTPDELADAVERA